MARPRNSERGTPAKDRIEKAFLEMLEHSSFSKITIRSLAEAANVNHNLIYYYYRDIYDLADKVFEKILQSGAPQLLLSVSTKETESLDNEVISRASEFLSQARLFAGSDSHYLVSLFRDGIMRVWLQQIGRTKGSLSEMERFQLEFIFNGITSIIGEREIEEIVGLIPEFLRSALGSAVVETLFNISKGSMKGGSL